MLLIYLLCSIERMTQICLRFDYVRCNKKQSCIKYLGLRVSV